MRFEKDDIVRHFKYETLTDEEKQANKYMYRIIGPAIHSETREELMVYQALYGEKLMFVRPMEMFLEEVDHKKYPDIKQKYRFEAVREG